MTDEEIGRLVVDYIITNKMLKAVDKHVIVWDGCAAEQIGCYIKNVLKLNKSDE